MRLSRPWIPSGQCFSPALRSDEYKSHQSLELAMPLSPASFTSASIRVLIVEDNQDILANLYAFLEPLGYALDCACNGLTGLNMIHEGCFDVVILDIMLPGMDGLTLCRTLRSEGMAVPVIMLTARDTILDKVAGLDCGADDYLVKPFSMKELDARLRALVRRAHGEQKKTLTWGTVSIDPTAHMARRGDVPLRLTPTGFTILAALVRAAPDVVSKAELEELIWGDEPREGSALRTHIHELRRILDRPFRISLLKTIPHVGYALNMEEQASVED